MSKTQSPDPVAEKPFGYYYKSLGGRGILHVVGEASEALIAADMAAARDYPTGHQCVPLFARSGPAPAGWRLVPDEPTVEMGWAYLDAARLHAADGAADTMRFSWGGYRAMLKAAPPAPCAAVQDEKTPAGYNRPPNGEPAHPEDWNAGYEAGLADGHEAGLHSGKLAVAWLYEHDGSLDEPILTASRWPECREPWNETPLDALALAKHAIEKVWLDAVGTVHGEHSISEAARKRVEFAAEALKLGLRLPGTLRKTCVESPISNPKGSQS